MLLYGGILLVFGVLTLGLNVWLAADLVNALQWMGIGILILFGVDLVCILVARLLPKKIYNPLAWVFRVRPWEVTICLKLGVKVWKDRVPELGKLGGFRKDKIDNLNAAYLYQFLQENCLADVAHTFSVLLSPLVFFLPARYALTIALPFMLCNMLLNTMSTLIQKYLRPKFVALYRRQKMKEERATAANTEN